MKPETERETFTLVSCSAVNTAALVSLALATVFSTTEYQVDKPFKYQHKYLQTSFAHIHFSAFWQYMIPVLFYHIPVPSYQFQVNSYLFWQTRLATFFH